jgi:hypothetical protein
VGTPTVREDDDNGRHLTIETHTEPALEVLSQPFHRGVELFTLKARHRPNAVLYRRRRRHPDQEGVEIRAQLKLEALVPDA